MTNEEAARILFAKAICMKRELSGEDLDCKRRNCDSCELCYAQGTTGEQIEAFIKSHNLIYNITNNGFTVIDLLTGKEADTYEIALHEDWAKNLVYCDMEGFAMQEDGSLILMDECGNYAYCPLERFEIRWE